MKIGKILSSAWKTLFSRYGRTLLTILAYFVIVFAISLLNLIPVIGMIAMYVILVPLQFGFTKQFIALNNGEEVKAFDFLHLGFESFGMAWKVALRLVLKYLGVIILMVVSYALNAVAITMSASAILGAGNAGSADIFSLLGSIGIIVSTIWSIILSLKYMFVYNELAHDANRTAKEVVEVEKKNMKGNKGNLFLLELLLVALMFIIVMLSASIPALAIIVTIALFLIFVPYLQFIMVTFYEVARNEKMPKVESTETIEYNNNNDPQDPIQM